MSRAQAALVENDLTEAVSAFAEARKAGAPLRQTAERHAIALSELGQHVEAIEVLKPWFDKNRKSYPVVNLMGVLLKRAGRFSKAVQVLEQARKLKPGVVSAWQNLGNVHEAMGDFEAAAKAFRGGLRADPKSAELWRLYGRALLGLGRSEEAVESLRKAVMLAPRDMAAVGMLTTTLRQVGRAAEAWALLDRLATQRPGDPEIAVAMARLHHRDGLLDKARKLLSKVIASSPGHLAANMLLAVSYGDSDREAANAAYARAVEANPGSFEALNGFVDSLARSRYGSEVAHLERAYALGLGLLDRFPSRTPDAARTLRTVFMRVLDEDAMARTGTLASLLPVWFADGRHSNVHYELGQVTSLEDRLQLVDWHRQWGRKASRDMTPVDQIATPALATGRKLRIGFMSSDLRHHPVTYFALPLLEGYDRDQVDVYCYSFNEKPEDKVQSLIAGKVTAFRHWPRRPDAQVAEGIAQDGLDILFELGGSTAMNKLEVMAYRPARLGASWLGYPHSLGLEQIDLILTDPYIRPDDPRLLIERPFEMPETWVAISRMFAEIDISEGTPEARKGHLTFGTANNPYKYTPACLDAWAAILRTVPGSRFIFLRPEAGAESFVRNARAAFAQRDVDPDRLEFIGIRGGHLPHYNEIDIALDTLPHVGGTTTCEALWMGVPTVSLVGPGFPERLSYSNLSNAGLGDLAVFSIADYVAKAAELAADPARRAAMRRGARAAIRANPLGQPERFTKAFYDLAQRVASE
jgi:predicted O-linked N-acetylglucosamine transferase (SPINDLY family)